MKKQNTFGLVLMGTLLLLVIGLNVSLASNLSIKSKALPAGAIYKDAPDSQASDPVVGEVKRALMELGLMEKSDVITNEHDAALTDAIVNFQVKSGTLAITGNLNPLTIESIKKAAQEQEIVEDFQR